MSKHETASDVRSAVAQVIAEWKASGKRFSADWYLTRRNEILDNR
jgi:hypothetical protein